MVEALARLQQDIWVVSAATLGRHRIRRRTLDCATQAFENAGDPAHRAWSELIANISQLLAYRDEFPPGRDSRERRRLQLFVEENADALVLGVLIVSVGVHDGATA